MSKSNRNFDINLKIVKGLLHLRDINKFLGNPFRAKAYKNAADIIAALPVPLAKNKIDNLINIHGIGKGIIDKIKLIVEDKPIIMLRDAYKEDKSECKLKAYLELSSVYGFGDATIKKLFSKGVYTIKDLQKIKPSLTHDQQLGLKYHNNLAKKVPRKETKKLVSIIKKHLKKIDPNTISEAVGSYRRGKKMSGDIDILIASNKDSKKVLNELLKVLRNTNIIVGDFTRKPTTKYMGIIRVPGHKTVRHLDIRVVPFKNYPFALLYFTGSQVFNVAMRTEAKRRGFKLNEYSLVNTITGAKTRAKTEKDIFKKLKMEYVSPKNR